MTNKEISAGNKLIGKFMGKNFEDPLNYMYDNEWSALMPVFEKIDKLGYPFMISKNNASIYIKDESRGFICFNCYTKKTIETSWKTVVEFVKWYNENKKKKK